MRWTTLGSQFNGGTALNPVIIKVGNQSISTNTGDLQVLGGIGVNGQVYARGTVYSNGVALLPTTSQEFIASGGQTTFIVAAGYSPGKVQVYANGVLLNQADFIASNGSTVVLVDGRKTGDTITVIAGVTANTVNSVQYLAVAMAVAFGA